MRAAASRPRLRQQQVDVGLELLARAIEGQGLAGALEPIQVRRASANGRPSRAGNASNAPSPRIRP